MAGSCGDSVESCFAMEMMDSYGDGWSSDFYSASSKASFLRKYFAVLKSVREWRKLESTIRPFGS